MLVTVVNGTCRVNAFRAKIVKQPISHNFQRAQHRFKSHTTRRCDVNLKYLFRHCLHRHDRNQRAIFNNANLFFDGKPCVCQIVLNVHLAASVTVKTLPRLCPRPRFGHCDEKFPFVFR